MNVIPYFPSLSDVRAYAAARLGGAAEQEALRSLTEGKRPREICRTTVAGAHGQPPLMLSAAIEGGSSVVKRGRPHTWRISTHGHWPRLHLGALEAAYGNTAYFPHLYPEIAAILANVSAGDPFPELTARLNKLLMDFIEAEQFIKIYLESDSQKQKILQLIAKENLTFATYELGFIDVIFKKGPESMLWLL